MKNSKIFAVLLTLFCQSAVFAKVQPIDQVNSLVDSFHQFASEAKADDYFDLMADNMVFMGTDASERWSKQEFKDFALPIFSKGRGWTYTVLQRHVQLNDDATIAWFDELLNNDSYGQCRGSGVLELTSQGWKLSQYNLSVPLPNAIAKNIVEQISQYKSQLKDK